MMGSEQPSLIPAEEVPSSISTGKYLEINFPNEKSDQFSVAMRGVNGAFEILSNESFGTHALPVPDSAFVCKDGDDDMDESHNDDGIPATYTLKMAKVLVGTRLSTQFTNKVAYVSVETDVVDSQRHNWSTENPQIIKNKTRLWNEHKKWYDGIVESFKWNKHQEIKYTCKFKTPSDNVRYLNEAQVVKLVENYVERTQATEVDITDWSDTDLHEAQLRLGVEVRDGITPADPFYHEGVVVCRRQLVLTWEYFCRFKSTLPNTSWYSSEATTNMARAHRLWAERDKSAGAEGATVYLNRIIYFVCAFFF